MGKYQNKLTAMFQLLIIAFPENVTMSTPAISKVETTTETVETNEKSKETTSNDSARNKNNQKECMITNHT